MDTKVSQVKPAVLAGEYGDVFWTLEPVTIYAPGTQIYTRVYVGNTTDVDREYLLMATVSRANVMLTEFPVIVDNVIWFEVESNRAISLPGVFVIDYTDAILTLNLYEKEQNDIVDSVFTALTSAGTEELIFPPIPEAPEPTDIIRSMLPLIAILMVMMMLGMMAKESAKGVEKNVK